MSERALRIDQHALHWSRHLFACLKEMAEQETNAVLLMLADVDVLETERRYPEAGLLFGDNHWRAFYHCHEAASRQANEHGHYHIFTDIGKQQWAHVAALAIDVSGQPLHWFAVNRWVTDGDWLKLEQFIHQLQTTTLSEHESLAGRWLFAMLQLYQSELTRLLQQRDEQIETCAAKQQAIDVLEDRAIYTLASRQIDLQAMLEKHLLH